MGGAGAFGPDGTSDDEEEFLDLFDGMSALGDVVSFDQRIDDDWELAVFEMADDRGLACRVGQLRVQDGVMEVAVRVEDQELDQQLTKVWRRTAAVPLLHEG